MTDKEEPGINLLRYEALLGNITQPGNQTQPENQVQPDNQAKPDNQVKPDYQAQPHNQTIPDNQAQLDYQTQPDNQTQPDYQAPPEHRDNQVQPDNHAKPDYQAQPDNQVKPDYQVPSPCKAQADYRSPPFFITGQPSNQETPLLAYLRENAPQSDLKPVVIGVVGEPDKTVLPPKPDPLPPPWTGFSICTLVFLFPVGLVALFCSYMVNWTHSKGKYAQSRVFSKIAMWLNGFGIVGTFILALLIFVFVI